MGSFTASLTEMNMTHRLAAHLPESVFSIYCLMEMQAHANIGNRWSRISKLLPGRYSPEPMLLLCLPARSCHLCFKHCCKRRISALVKEQFEAACPKRAHKCPQTTLHVPAVHKCLTKSIMSMVAIDGSTKLLLVAGLTMLSRTGGTQRWSSYCRLTRGGSPLR